MNPKGKFGQKKDNVENLHRKLWFFKKAKGEMS